MFNWKALSKNELKKEIEAFKRKDLKALRAMLEEIEKEEHYAWEMYMDAENEEEENKQEKIWSRMNDKWEIVRLRIDKLENERNKNNEPEPIRADRG